MKKKTRRQEARFPGLQKKYNSKAKQEYLDYDYLEDLTYEEKQFLNKFTEEFYGAALDFKNLDNNLHNTPELKKDCTDRNNARNRCIFSSMLATNRLVYTNLEMYNVDKEIDEFSEEYMTELLSLKELQDSGNNSGGKGNKT